MLRTPLLLSAALLVLMLGMLGCQEDSPPEGYIARVGESYLMRDELAATLQSLPFAQDTAEAQRQIVEQWVTNELLFQEASRQGLRSEPEVQRLLAQNERSVLISAYLQRVYDEAIDEPSSGAMEAYFEQNKEQLRLREPFVRVRYLNTTSQDSAQTGRSLLQQSLRDANPDSVWFLLIDRFATDGEGSRSLARQYYPESRLFATQPLLREALSRLRTGEIAPIFGADSSYHLLQLVDRVGVGSMPRMEWIEDELKQRLVIETRKQMYARQVQRLRTTALTREDLEIR